MGLKRVIARNVIWNWAGVVTSMAAGFVVAPFLVRRLGETTYGLWILMASLNGYFGLLDLGLRASVGRYIAFHRAKNDQEGVNTILSTALGVLSGVALLGLLLTAGVMMVFFHLFEVPPDQVAATRLALFIVGLNLAAMLPLNVFDATLWGFQRFDALNATDIVMVMIRTVLTFWLIGQGHGLVTLALLTLLLTLAGAGAKAVIGFRLNPELRLGPTHVRAWAVRRLYGYGLWNVLLSVARMALPKLNPIIIGSKMSVALVTPFAIASRLQEYATSIVSSSAGVLTPVATAFHAEEKHSQQQKLFVLGGKYCLALALFFCMLFLFLGRPFLTLWMGPTFASSAILLTILAIGELIPMSQYATNSLVLGMSRHKTLALMALIENVLAVGLILLLLGPLGLAGVCLGVALAGAIFRGIGPLVFGCRLVRISIWEYVRRAILPSVTAVALPTIALASIAHWQPPCSWLSLILEAGLFAAIYAVSSALVLIGYRPIHLRLTQMVRSAIGIEQEPELICH
jgi:O-antigen/teichoic acid export membrane protein